MVLICFLGLPLFHDRTNLHLVTFAIKSLLKSLTMENLWFCEREVFSRKCSLSYDLSYLLHWSAASWFILLLKNCVSVSTEKQISTLGGRKSCDSEAYVAQRTQGCRVLMVSSMSIFLFLTCCISVFSFRNLLGVGEIHWQLPTCWTLLEEILGFSRQQDGTKKAHMCRRNLDLTPQKTFLKFLVKWSWILFTYERGKLSLLPSIKPQCTILFFALYSFYWASIVS